MAEKPEDQFTSEEKIAKAKELYSRGCRNFYVKSYSEAADDLSEATKIFAEEYGVDGNELGEVYLLYAKALIAVGQEENKLVDVPEEDEDEEEGEEGAAAEPEIEPEKADDDATAAAAAGTNGIEKTNGNSDEPGPSGTNENESSNDAAETNGEEGEGEMEAEDDGGNLEVAWEVLQNAAVIFERQGTKGLSNLMDCYIEMGGISLENGNFEVAIKDLSRALDVFLDLEEVDQNKRIAAEVHYKIGLCQSMIKQYDDSVKSFQNAADLIDEVIAKEKTIEPQSEEILATIKDLEETQQEILNKITEIGDTKAEEVEEVKKELAKILGPGAGASSSADGAGTSSQAAAADASSVADKSKSPEAEKPKPTDISHLIKRKRTETDPVVGESPAKKPATETASPEAAKIADDNAATVQVIEN